LEERYGAVVLLHGIGSHSGSYAPLTNALLTSGYNVHSFDFRGHGRSGGTRGRFDSWRYLLQDLQLFLTHVHREEGDEQIFLLGHDLGALLALDYAVEFGNKIAGVVAVAPLIFGTEKERKGRRKRVREREREKK
jgi:alpha-beta hydrolase superfamily lysophospholipase